MAIADRDNSIISALAHTLKEHGFRRKGRTWYLDQPETILVVNLQRSQWSANFYINAAVWLKAAGDNPFPKEHHCQIRDRPQPASAAARDRFWRALDLEDQSMTAEERIPVISRVILKYVLPLLKKCSSIDSIRSAYEAGELDVLIDLDGLKICGIQPEF